MSIFRCYALNRCGRIVAAENLEQDDLARAVEAGWRFVAARPTDEQATGLEIWRDRVMLFSTNLNLAAQSLATSRSEMHAA